MGKLKGCKCMVCGKQIQRHDTSRMQVRVAVSWDTKGVYKQLHLGCRGGLVEVR